MTDADCRAIVINIQHFSTHDGPGIRSTVFLKGCSLRCQWCCNPEAIQARPELGLDAKRCIGAGECGKCLPVCEERAILSPGEAGPVGIDWETCSQCGKCAAVCPSQALFVYGRLMSVAEILAEVEQDGPFYSESGGGITISGGECLMQPDFCVALLREARRRGINSAIETAGNVPWEAMQKVLPYADVVLHDYKITDPLLHRQSTGAGNQRILDNFRRAYAAFPDIHFIARIPLVAGVNDGLGHIDAVLDHIAPYANVDGPELLPYHDFGDSKYAFTGRYRESGAFRAPSAEQLAALRAHIIRRAARTNKPAEEMAMRSVTSST